MAKKRANGEGSIRRKPNGRWEGRYTLGIDPATGRAIQKSVSAKTRAECKEKLERAIRDNRGIPMDHNEDYTVATGYLNSEKTVAAVQMLADGVFPHLKAVRAAIAESFDVQKVEP